MQASGRHTTKEKRANAERLWRGFIRVEDVRIMHFDVIELPRLQVIISIELEVRTLTRSCPKEQCFEQNDQKNDLHFDGKCSIFNL